MEAAVRRAAGPSSMVVGRSTDRHALVSQLAEETDSKPVQCEFESHRGHHAVTGRQWRKRRARRVDTDQRGAEQPAQPFTILVFWMGRGPRSSRRSRVSPGRH